MAVWWVRWERSRPDPIVDLALSSSGPVLLAHLGGVMVGFATFAQFIASFTLVSMPAATGHGLGRTVAVAGLVQLPGAALMGISVLVSTRISARPGFVRPAARRRRRDRRRVRAVRRPPRLGRRGRAQRGRGERGAGGQLLLPPDPDHGARGPGPDRGGQRRERPGPGGRVGAGLGDRHRRHGHRRRGGRRRRATGRVDLRGRLRHRRHPRGGRGGPGVAGRAPARRRSLALNSS